MSKERASDLEQFTEHLEALRVVPTITDSYPLAEAREAMRSLEAGDVRGKLVIIPLNTQQGN